MQKYTSVKSCDNICNNFKLKFVNALSIGVFFSRKTVFASLPLPSRELQRLLCRQPCLLWFPHTLHFNSFPYSDISYGDPTIARVHFPSPQHSEPQAAEFFLHIRLDFAIFHMNHRLFTCVIFK